LTAILERPGSTKQLRMPGDAEGSRLRRGRETRSWILGVLAAQTISSRHSCSSINLWACQPVDYGRYNGLCIQYRSLHTLVQKALARIPLLLQSLVMPVFTYLSAMLERYTRRHLQAKHTVNVERQEHHLVPTPEPITDIFENRSRTLEDLVEMRGRPLGLPKRAYKSKSVALSILKFYWNKVPLVA
jgi:hypothetical protein